MSVTQTDSLESLHDDAWPVLEQLARALRLKDADLQSTVDAIAAMAVETIEPAVHCGLILVMHGAMVPQTTVGKPPEVLDLWQQQHGSGPCLDAAQQQQIIVVPDTAREQRWGEFGEAAVTLGVSSMLCVPLWVEDQCLGALSLYAQDTNPFNEHHVRLTNLFATHAALALADANRAEHLRVALKNRDVIGQAKGILMERERITSIAAFDLLVVASQATNLKLIAVAQHLVDTGELLTARPRKMATRAAGVHGANGATGTVGLPG